MNRFDTERRSKAPMSKRPHCAMVPERIASIPEVRLRVRVKFNYKAKVKVQIKVKVEAKVRYLW